MPGEGEDFGPFPNAKTRTGVWLLFCMAVQAFMSYDGGATPASLEVIQNATRAQTGVELSQIDIGLLGALDKIGMTIAGIVWGRALQLFPTKPLLVCSLALNALCTFLFGLLTFKYSMFACKFFMGVTQGLQGVWGTVWILTYAPAEVKTQWMGMGAIAAGLGNGIGTAVAGFGTANGLSYSFAFFLQAAVLGLLWVCMVCTPSSWLQLPLASDDPTNGNESPNGMGAMAQLAVIRTNKVYLYTALSICQVFFINSGIQFIWVRLFVEGAWTLDKSLVTVAFLVVTGAGSFVGVALGPILVDKYGGYEDDEGKARSLRILVRITSICTFGALIAVIAVLCHFAFSAAADKSAMNLWIWMMWFGVSLIFMGDSATIATHTAINVEVVSEEMRSFASGMTISMQNLLGFAGGTLVPGVFMDVSQRVYTSYMSTEDVPDTLSMEALLDLGFVFICGISVTLLITVSLASRAAGLRAFASSNSPSSLTSEVALTPHGVRKSGSFVDLIGAAELEQKEARHSTRKSCPLRANEMGATNAQITLGQSF